MAKNRWSKSVTKQAPEKLRAVQELRRSGASGKHYDTTPRTQINQKEIEEGLEDYEN